jgi:hypothetical protein
MRNTRDYAVPLNNQANGKTMTAERKNERTHTLQTVEFIDSWLDKNAMWVDARVMDFALDVRTLLAADPLAENDERSKVPADA